MWTLYTLATKTGQRPSSLLGYWLDPWTAYQLDRAVVTVGIALDNASQELHNVGDEKKPKWAPRYRMEQLLDEQFRLPAPERPPEGVAALKAMARLGKGVRYRKVKAE
jgi:hypothetical protein